MQVDFKKPSVSKLSFIESLNFFKCCCSTLSEEEHNFDFDCQTPLGRPRADSSIHFKQGLYQKTLPTLTTIRDSVLEPITESP